MPDELVHMAVTSPPYFNTRVYEVPETDLKGWRGCLGNETSLELYLEHLSMIFSEVKRVLRNDGTLWLNLGDGYAGSGFRHYPYRRKGVGLKIKDQCLVPHRTALALQGYAVIYADELWKLVESLHSARENCDWEAVRLVEDTLRKWAFTAKLAHASGWWLRSTIIWQKSNGVPSGVQDRPATDFEYVFLLSKSKRYYYDAEAIKEPQKEVSIKRALANNHLEKRKDQGKDIYALSSASQSRMLAKLSDSIRNGEKPLRHKRCVWTIPTQGLKEEHYAVFPERLIVPMILAGTSPKVCAACGAPQKRIVQGQQTIGWKASCACNAGAAKAIVLDPFIGAGTTALVATELGRDYIGIEIGEKYIEMSRRRLERIKPSFLE
jgi:DNA modification methylase